VFVCCLSSIFSESIRSIIDYALSVCFTYVVNLRRAAKVSYRGVISAAHRHIGIFVLSCSICYVVSVVLFVLYMSVYFVLFVSTVLYMYICYVFICSDD
jgi:hypothetical protein